MREKIQHSVIAAIRKLQTEGVLASNLEYTVIVEQTKQRQHGDFTTNVALILAKIAKLNPRDLAQMIINNFAPLAILDSIEIAGPGFINFFLTDSALYAVINEILTHGPYYGTSTVGQSKKINVEFVSSNPTGPLHVGHGRGAAYGDTVANLLEAMGYNVDREYYVNDAGRQMHILATSVWLRYLSLFHDLPHFPLNGYKGDYILEIAKQLQVANGDLFMRSLEKLFRDLPKDADEDGDADIYVDNLIARAKELLGERDYSLVFDSGAQTILADIKSDLEEFGVSFNHWFMESSLVTEGHIKHGLEKLTAKDCLYQKDGATWFKATDFGDEKDRVVIRENGQTTYFASDIAYHLNKYERGYDQIIDVFGADHHGYAPRINAFLQALGLDNKKFLVLLVQFAILYRAGLKAQMSTRSGEFVTLRELRNEVGKDAARFFYVMRKNDQHLDFDLDLAKAQSADNPVYYIQYAHARICSVMRQLYEKNWRLDKDAGLKNLHLLKESSEENIIVHLNNYAQTLQSAALNYAPHTLAHYLIELANDFHSYYNAQQFLVADENLRNARLCLIEAIKQILANGLGLLGVSAPEVM